MTKTVPYTLVKPDIPPIPILVSVPHSGTSFPPALQTMYHEKHIGQPDDTDWFVHQLYDFAPQMGITLLHARYSRYVIDLNRDPDDRPLYDDGRTLTGLTPSYTFFREPLYKDTLPTATDIEQRKLSIYRPYHQAIREQLDELRAQFPHVLLWEAHSIRRLVPHIRKQPFPDMILGDQESRTAHPLLSDLALQNLRDSPQTVSHNAPFKGGYITRHFGQPDAGFHALQLEMTKDNYMDEETCLYLPEKADIIRALLQKTFRALYTQLLTLPPLTQDQRTTT